MKGQLAALAALAAPAAAILCEKQAEANVDLSAAVRKIKFPADMNVRFELKTGGSDKITATIDYSADIAFDESTMLSVSDEVATFQFDKLVKEAPEPEAPSAASRAQAASMLALAAAVGQESREAGLALGALGMLSCANGAPTCEVDVEVVLTVPEELCFGSGSDGEISLTSSGCDFDGTNQPTSSPTSSAPTSSAPTSSPTVMPDVTDSIKALNAKLDALASGATLGDAIVEGVVAVDMRSSRRGFTVQMPKAHADAVDIEASEGIYVYCGGSCSDFELALGQTVRVKGVAKRFKLLNQIEVSDIKIVCSEPTVDFDEGVNAIKLCAEINVVDVRLGVDEAVLLRSSGMLANVQDLTVVDQFAQYGSLLVTEGERPFSETMEYAPGDAALARRAEIDRMTIKMDDLSTLQCVTTMPWDLEGSDSMRVGWKLPGAFLSKRVLLTYDFDRMTLVPVPRIQDQIAGAFDQTPNPRPDVPTSKASDENGIRVVGMNVLNYFTTDLVTGRGATNIGELERQEAKMFAALKELDGAVVGLQELENDDDKTVANLTSGLNEFIGAPGRYAYISVPQSLSTDQITNGIIYDTNLVEPQGDMAHLEYSKDGDAQKSRPSIAQSFRRKVGGVAVGNVFTVVVQHLKSKGSACSEDKGDGSKVLFGEGNCGYTRYLHAQELVDWLKEDPTGQNSQRMVLLGDFNSHAKERSMEHLWENGFVNEVDGSYSYVFQGTRATLDYMATKGDVGCDAAEEWHINADENPFKGYFDGFLSYSSNSNTVKYCVDTDKPSSWIDLGADAEFRSSDHDPVLAYCTFDGTNQPTSSPISSPPTSSPTVMPDVTDNIKALNAKLDALASGATLGDAIVEGVVAVDMRSSRRGFTVQMPKAHADAVDIEASEGIYVYCGGSCSDFELALGQTVRVKGVAKRYKLLNQIEVSAVEVLCSEPTVDFDEGVNAIKLCAEINVVDVRLGVDEAVLLRSSGMLANVQDLTVVDQFAQYGSLLVTEGERPFSETMEYAPGDAALARRAEIDRMTIKMDDLSTLQCVTTMPWDLEGSDSMRVGWKLPGAFLSKRVLLTYDFDRMTLVPVPRIQDQIAGAFDQTPNPRPDVPTSKVSDENGIRVVGMNVLNYFTTDLVTGRGATNIGELERQEAKMFAALKELDGAVVGLQELENDDDKTVANLTSGLNEFIGAPGRYAYISVPQSLSTDQITNGIIYDTNLVEPQGDMAHLEYSKDGDAQKSRPSIAQSFRRKVGGVAVGNVFTVVVQHLKSKGSACSEDKGDGSKVLFGEGNCGYTRYLHAQELVDWLKEDPTGQNSQRMVLLGDFNSHAKERSMEHLWENGFVNEVDGSYSYVFRGTRATLDYMVTKGGVGCDPAEEWHINADENPFKGYFDGFLSYSSNSNTVKYCVDTDKPSSWIDLGADAEFRSSDHDPVLAYCTFDGTNQPTSSPISSPPTSSPTVMPDVTDNIKALNAKLDALASGATLGDAIVEGVVAVDMRSSRRGFTVQMPKAHADAVDIEASEGIYVYCGGSCSDFELALGQTVRVKGVAKRYKLLNQIEVSAVEVLCSEPTVDFDEGVNAIKLCAEINVVDVRLGVDEAVLLRSSGMLANVQDLTVVDQFAQYGSLLVTEGERPFSETMEYAPGDAALARRAEIDRMTIKMDDLSTLQCVTTMPWDLEGSDSMRVGWKLPGAFLSKRVLLTYDFDRMTLVPVPRIQDQIAGAFDQTPNPRPDVPTSKVSDENGIRVVGMNVLNYFTTDLVTGRGATNIGELERQEAKMFAALKELDGAVVGLQELENDDDKTVANLTSGLNEFIGAPGRYAYISVPQSLSTDQITNGIIYDTNLVEPQGDMAHLEYSKDGDAQKSRPSIAQSFRRKVGGVAVGNVFTVVVQHLKSKGSACSEDKGDGSKVLFGEGNCGYTRYLHAQELVDWLKEDPTGQNSQRMVLLGDFNSHAKERSMEHLWENGFVNEVDGSYSYVFRGTRATLDYMVTKGGVGCDPAEEWHINADENPFKGYFDGFLSYSSNSNTVKYCVDTDKPSSWIDLGADAEFRSSDHDPVLAYCTFDGTNQPTSSPISSPPTSSPTVMPDVTDNIKALNAKLDALASGATLGDAIVEGVVAVDMRSSRRGFTVQMPKAHADAVDIEASEGIYVYCGGSCSDFELALGQTVRVKGVAKRYKLLNQIEVSAVEVLCSEPTVDFDEGVNAIKLCAEINVVDVRLGVDEAVLLRSSGMLANVQDLTVVDQFAQYGSLLVTEGERPFSETMEYAPGDAALARRAEIDRMTIKMDDLSTLQCVTTMPWDLEGSDSMRVGWKLPGAFLSKRVLLTYDFDRMTLVPVPRIQDQIAGAFDQTPNPRPDVPTSKVSDENGIRVVGMNVLNYFTTDLVTGRGATNIGELERQEAKMFAALKELDGAVVGLQELENDDDKTVANLTSGLNEFIGAPGRYAYISVPQSLSTDQITNGIIYDTNLVEPQGDMAHLEYSKDGDAQKSRPSIAQSFRRKVGGVAVGNVFTVVVQHLKSKGSACSEDKGDGSKVLFGEGNCGYTRYLHAQELVDWLKEDPTGQNSQRMVLLGDFNSHAKERSMEHLWENGFVNEVDGSYSYVFRGTRATLDYMVTKGGVGCDPAEEWHINADENPFKGYFDGFLSYSSNSNTVRYCVDTDKPSSWIDLGADAEFRSSDHDPVLAYCTF